MPKSWLDVLCLLSTKSIRSCACPPTVAIEASYNDTGWAALSLVIGENSASIRLNFCEFFLIALLVANFRTIVA